MQKPQNFVIIIHVVTQCRFAYSAERSILPCYNYLLSLLSRDATNKLFSSVVQQRRTEIQANPKISRSLLAFQR